MCPSGAFYYMNKQTGINFIAQAIAFAINFCVSFFLTPFIIENIGVEANGYVTLANSFVDYATLFTIAINSMTGRYITIKLHQNKLEEANKYLSSVIFANAFMSFVFSLIFAFVVIFLDKILNISQAALNDTKILFAFIFLNFVITLFASTFSISAFATDRLDKTAATNARGSIIRGAALVICYTFFRPYTFYVGIATLLQGGNYLISHIIYKHRLTPELQIKKKYFDFACIKELVSSGIWNSISRLSTILTTGLDLLIANLFVGGVAMGVLNVSKTPSNVIIALFSTLASIFAPQLTISYANNNTEEMKKQLVFSIKLLAVFSSIPIGIFVGLGKAFFSLWVPSQDAAILHILTLITCSSLIFALPLEPLYNIFTVSNKIKVPSIALVLFSAASAATILIGINFVNGENEKLIFIVAVSAFFSIIRVLTFLPIYGAKCLNFKHSIFYKVILRNLAAVIMLIIISVAVNHFFTINTWLGLILACGIIAILGLVANALTLFSKEELQRLLSIAKRYIGKILVRSK